MTGNMANQAIAGSAADVLARVAAAFCLTAADLTGPRQMAPIVRARQAAVWILRSYCQMDEKPRSWLWIGRAMGGRDHTTMMHAFARAEAAMATDPAMAATVKSLLNALPGRPAACDFTPPVITLPAAAASNSRHGGLIDDDTDAVKRWRGSKALAGALNRELAKRAARC